MWSLARRKGRTCLRLTPGSYSVKDMLVKPTRNMAIRPWQKAHQHHLEPVTQHLPAPARTAGCPSLWRTAPCTTTCGTRTARSKGTATPRSSPRSTPPAPPGHTAPNPHLARSSINFYWGNIGPILQVKRGKSKFFRLKARKLNLLKMYQAV